jgi:nucleotide-binding universal stress UspA family protein
VGKEVRGRSHYTEVNISQKGTWMNPRWLLPFTHGVDMQAIDYLVSLAENNGATLIPVSLVSVPDDSRSRGARLEYIQQSKDFLEAVKYKAARFQVPLERYEVFTSDVIQSITMLVHDLHCDAIVMVAIEHKEVLLRAHELKQLLVEPPASLVLIRLPAHPQEARAFYLGAGLLSWLHRVWRNRVAIRPMKNTLEAESISQIRKSAPQSRTGE